MLTALFFQARAKKSPASFAGSRAE